MFIRKNFDPNRNRTLVRTVESVRCGNKVRQKTVRHVSTADSDQQLEQLVYLGQAIEPIIGHLKSDGLLCRNYLHLVKPRWSSPKIPVKVEM